MSLSLPWISDEVQRLKKRFRVQSPQELCDALHILILHSPMGTVPEACKGFTLCQDGVFVISVNADMGEDMQKWVLAHETGHAVLHTALLRDHPLLDIHPFSMEHILEREANLFAAEWLLDDADIMELVHDGHDFYAIASLLHVPPVLLAYKVQFLAGRGISLLSPIPGCGDFLSALPLQVPET